ncbi:TatD family hydrolase [Aliidiomarina haloalkalitolerans]|uniref:Metal-dependent hydrolase n=1 Tax=Aliidiomarina haloalkalitolerans TaxID=859059 RepID=A0A432VYG0_9GAMM|nr:TatD family hydrolase [Aliidiomarina haloalkalitolerans]RUO21706.1 metal-dependent hydrolase [Aliidiomarina haloalkalitolerans]
MFVDSHCHLDKLKVTEELGIEQVLADAKAARVEHMLCIGVALDDFEQMQGIVGQHRHVSFSCGVHPLYVAKHGYVGAQLAAVCAREDVVAVGETGLDYYYDKDHIQAQQDSFAHHIEVANAVQKPLIIHTRDAREDTIAMLREGQAQHCRGVMHCFTESLEMAEQALDLGFYISISGIVTFRNAKELRHVVENVPIERLLIETDAPWLAPIPHRGKENHPAYVQHVAECVAQLKGLDVAEVAEITRNNFYELFKLQRTALNN